MLQNTSTVNTYSEQNLKDKITELDAIRETFIKIKKRQKALNEQVNRDTFLKNEYKYYLKTISKSKLDPTDSGYHPIIPTSATAGFKKFIEECKQVEKDYSGICQESCRLSF